jgi:hypothetical protein
VTSPVVRQGRRLMRYVAVFNASAQKDSGAAQWVSNVRMQSLIVRRIRSTLPFCCEVYGHERRNAVPCVARNERMAALSNSVPLSVWKATMGSRNWVAT